MIAKMKKISVLHIILDLGPGGVEKFLVDLLTTYNKNKFQMEVICLYPRKNDIFEKVLDDAGVRVYYLDKIKYFDIRMWYKIGKIIKIFKPDVIHAHLFMIRYALIPSIIYNIPVKLHTVHVPMEKETKNYILRIMHKIAYKKCNFIPIAISDSVRNSILGYQKLNNVPVIYNGVDLDKYKNSNEVKEKEIFNLICVARFRPAKDHALLIDAFNIVCKSKTNVNLILVGEGPLRRDIEEKVKSLGIEDKVKFMGVRSDISNLLSKSDIFVLTSKFEGFGLVLIEAMACGLPIVSTNVGGIPEIVKNKVNGILIESRVCDEFAEGILKLLDNKKLRESMGEHSLNIVSKFDLRSTVKKYENLYEEQVLKSSKKCKG